VALQSANRADDHLQAAVRGFVKTNQRELQARSNLSAAPVNEASQFFAHISWMRVAKRGILQLNPWLTVAGTSGEQEKWQALWNSAQGPVCIIPHSDYPTEWRQAREAEKEAAVSARRKEKVVTLRQRRPVRKTSA
jgi:hypothetical protein